MSSRATMGNIPNLTTSFVDRRDERAQIKQLLADQRLITLTGVGGVGKTHLAVHMAGEIRQMFRNGAWLVELAGVVNPSLVATTVVDTLGLRHQSSESTIKALTRYLAPRELLLLLDNCEHVVEVCAELVDELLRSCPKIRVIATSRQPLRVHGEMTLPIESLATPEKDGLPAESLGQYPAVTLFMERAKAALGEFKLTPENTDAVAQICRQLDGIPLALELASVRLRILSPQQMLDMLGQGNALLGGGARTSPSRHQNLYASINWSYELCSSAEQDLWERVSVFAGGFEFDALPAVSTPQHRIDQLLELIASLVDKSVLLREDYGRVVRYRLLEPIRQFGWEKLSTSGKLETLRRRHREFYADLVIKAHDDWISSRQVLWLQRLRREHANLQAALQFCLDQPGEARTGFRMAAHLHYYWRARGLLGEGQHWLSGARQRIGTLTCPPPAIELAHGFHDEAYLALMQGDVPVAKDLLERGNALVDESVSRTQDTRREVALMNQVKGAVAMIRGETEIACTSLGEALEQFHALNDIGRQIDTRFLLGMSALGAPGRADLAIECHESNLKTTALQGEVWYRSYSLWGLGTGMWIQGDSDRGAEAARESLQLASEIDDPVRDGLCMELLAWIAASHGDARRAATLFGAAATTWELAGTSLEIIPHLASIGHDIERETRRTLGSRSFASAYRFGREHNNEQARRYALGQDTGSRPNPRTASSTLTAREKQVADLVGQGLSNKDIAKALVIAQRTAESHVEHIMNKLEFTSRAQIAAWVAERSSILKN